jgi:hypothetical protein
MNACCSDIATPHTYDAFSGVLSAHARQHLPDASTSDISEGIETATTSTKAENYNERVWATESTLIIQDKLVDNDDLIKTNDLSTNDLSTNDLSTNDLSSNDLSSNDLSSTNDLSKTDELLSRMIHLQGEILGLQSHLLIARERARTTENNNNDRSNTDELLSRMIHLQGQMLDIQSQLLGVWQPDCHDLHEAMTGNPFMGACDENDFERHLADQHPSTLDPIHFLRVSPRLLSTK